MTYINRISDKFDFGKFKGCSLAEILYWNPDYVNWGETYGDNPIDAKFIREGIEYGR